MKKKFWNDTRNEYEHFQVELWYIITARLVPGGVGRFSSTRERYLCHFYWKNITRTSSFVAVVACNRLQKDRWVFIHIYIKWSTVYEVPATAARYVTSKWWPTNDAGSTLMYALLTLPLISCRLPPTRRAALAAPPQRAGGATASSNRHQALPAQLPPRTGSR